VRVVHALLSASLAGVEHVVASNVTTLAQWGHDVRLLTDQPQGMAALTSVPVVPVTGVAGLARALLAHRRADVVHSHLTASDVAVAAVRSRLASATVSTRHFPYPRGSGRFAGWWRPYVSAAFDLQVAPSRFVADRVDGDCVVVPFGVEPQQPGPWPRARSVLVLSRLEREKRVDVALRAFAASTLPASGWRLTVAGSGSQRGELRTLSRALRIDQQVDWLGSVPDPNAVMTTAAALLAPCPVESFGRAVVEAMAVGTPVVAAHGGAHTETLGDLGLFFDPGDVAGCTQLLDLLATDSVDGSLLGQQLRTRQRSRFDLDRSVATLVDFYEGLA
jgi:glycosyltransferase involved in cell wall biosynthesis